MKLNHKWDVSFLENYITQKIIPRALRDRVIPAEQLHNDKCIPKLKELCISHGIDLMRLIVEEEMAQLEDLKTEIDQSSLDLSLVKEEE